MQCIVKKSLFLKCGFFFIYTHGRDRYETIVVRIKTHFQKTMSFQYLQTGNTSFNYLGIVVVVFFFTQVVRMLIVIVVLFGTLWLPYRIVVVYNSFQDGLLQFKDSWFWLFCRTMVFINSAINPVIYNMLSVKFRRAFRDIVCKGKTS